MRIAELSPSDAPRVVDLWRRAGLVRPWNDPTADFQRALTSPASTVLGAFIDDELLATVMAGFDGHRGWLYYVAVEPHRLREGIGRALVGAAEVWLAERGAGKVQLMVRAGNEGAEHFYDALGYERGDVILMQKWLVDPGVPTTNRSSS